MPRKPEPEQKSLLIGVDDATKCPCIGGIFVSAVSATPNTVRRWKRAGVTDSKRITAPRREKLAELIRATATAYLIREIPPARIDDKLFNLNEWEMITVLELIRDLKDHHDVDEVVIDNWEVSEALFHRRLRSILGEDVLERIKDKGILLEAFAFKHVRFIPEHQADERHVVVGAASILSKTASEAQYREIRERYGDFGSGNPGDRLTKRFLWEHRLDPPPVIRTSWRTFQRIRVLECAEDAAAYRVIRKTRKRKKF